MKYFVTIGPRTLEVELGPRGVRVDGQEVSADLAEMDGTQVHTLLVGGRSHRILTARNGGGEWSLYLSGRHLKAQVMDERTRAIREMTGMREGSGGPKALRAPMPGLVVKVEVEEGDQVFPGQGLVIVEAMKMENELKSDGEALVSRVLIASGDAVEKDQVLIEFEALKVDGEEGPPG
ncbi:biotin/lipoyl-containing protein [Gemmatimonadota bacterium]